MIDDMMDDVTFWSAWWTMPMRPSDILANYKLWLSRKGLGAHVGGLLVLSADLRRSRKVKAVTMPGNNSGTHKYLPAALWQGECDLDAFINNVGWGLHLTASDIYYNHYLPWCGTNPLRIPTARLFAAQLAKSDAVDRELGCVTKYIESRSYI